MNVLIIGNSISGRGKTTQRVDKLAGMLKYNGHSVEVFLSSKPRDALIRAASIGADLQRIVIAGGDGTVNEVLNGLLDPSIVPIVHLATGTANMLARELALPTSVSETASLVDTGGNEDPSIFGSNSSSFDGLTSPRVGRKLFEFMC